MKYKEKVNEKLCKTIDLFEQIEYMIAARKNKQNEFQITKEFLMVINEFISEWMATRINCNSIEMLMEEMVNISLKMGIVKADLLEEKLQKLFTEIKKLNCKLDTQIPVVLYGNTRNTFLFLKIVNSLKISILGIVITNENEYTEEVFNNLGIDTFQKSELFKKNFNYLILCDHFEMLEESKKHKSIIVNFLNFIYKYIIQSSEFLLNFNEYFQNLRGNYNGIITGISYIQWGIYWEKLKVPMAFLANPGQDLYYDYKMFQYAYNRSVNPQNIRYAIIGLSLYSFEYDMSKSKVTEMRTLYYYPVVETMHHYKYKDISIQEYETVQSLLKKLVINNYQESIWNMIREDILNLHKKSGHEEFDSKKLTEEEYLEIIKDEVKTFSKNYPETVKENIKIFEEYIQFLKDHNIEILVIIPPFTKVYQQCINEKMEQKTLEIVECFKTKYNFEFWNLSRSNEFEDIDFRDASHLNLRGAEKLTNFINKWCDERILYE